jgi:hypothetical protein
LVVNSESKEDHHSKAALKAVQYGHAAIAGVLMRRLLTLVKADERSDWISKSAGVIGGTINNTEPGETAILEASGDKSLGTELGPESQDLNPRWSRAPSVAQAVLEHTIEVGHHKVLNQLLEVLQQESTTPESFMLLCKIAVTLNRPKCLSEILGAYHEISLHSMNLLLDLGTSSQRVAVTDVLLKQGTVLDDQTFPATLDTAMSAEPIVPEMIQLLIDSGREPVSDIVFIKSISKCECENEEWGDGPLSCCQMGLSRLCC